MSQSDFVSRGQALVAAGQFQEAVKVCRLGLLGRPTTVEGRVVLGQALLALKRFDEVLAEMRVALELDHSSIPAQVLKAEALLRKGDTVPAIEALHKARLAAPGDPRILQLLGEAEHGGRHASVSHPAVGFVGSGDTKHYPGHSSGSEESEGTKPTSLSSPGGARRSSQRRAAVGPETERASEGWRAGPEPTPAPAALEVGDRSGTVEVDPDLEGVEMEGDIDFDDLAAPPKASKPNKIGGARGSVNSSSQNPGTVVGKASAKNPVAPTLALDLDADDDIEELAETRAPESRARAPGPSTAVRNAVARPSGVIGESDFGQSLSQRAKGKSVPPPRSSPASVPPPRSHPSSVPPPRSHPASAPPPASMLVTQLPPAPLPPAPQRVPIAAAMPTLAAAQPPPPYAQASPFGQSPYQAPSAPANYPTMAIAAPPMSAAQQQTAAAVDNLFGNEGPPPSWSRSTVAAGAPDPRSMAAANEPTARPGELDPAILALMSGSPADPTEHVSGTPPKGAGMKTGVRKGRSRMQVVMWFVIGIVVIGGGVFAGFQIRKMRLEKQIVAARQHATDLAKADTWTGWTAARDSLAGIVQASGTFANRAALARARALIAFEFGDGMAEAKTAVDGLGGKGGLDANVAATFLALAETNAKAAKLAADAAVAGSENDASAQYVAGQAALLAGDAKLAVAAMKIAADKDARPLFGIGLARAYASAYNWDEARAAIDRVLAGNVDHPAGVIARSNVLVASGQVFPGSALGNELHRQLERVIAEGKRPIAEQQHGVSPTQVAFASLALAQVDFARGDVKAARGYVRVAASINLDDQRFAETAAETLYLLGDLMLGRSAADQAVKTWPATRRARILLAQISLAQGKAAEAIDTLNKQADVMTTPDGLATRGLALLAMGDTTSAATDFDAALKKHPSHEPAIVGRAWLELATDEVEAATKRVAERYNATGSSAALTTVYAATLRRSADPKSRDMAKELLEKIVQGPAGLDVLNAQLELARIYRDVGDYEKAKTSFVAASRAGNFDARLEGALLAIEDRDAKGGRETLDVLLTEAGDRPSPVLVIEAVRARLLNGAHDEAAKLLEIADKMSAVERWKLDRERGRLALRKSDFAAATAALSRALDTCGGDIETFLLAADVATADEKLGEKVKKLAPERLKGRPEVHIVNGKLLIAAKKPVEATAAYKKAKEALKAEKATVRRQAQADLGLALIAYYGDNVAETERALALVISEDPSIVDAYMFAADTTKDRKKAFEHVQTATRLNPDYAYAWATLGELAHELGDKRTLTDAISRLSTIAPGSDDLKKLQALRR